MLLQSTHFGTASTWVSDNSRRAVGVFGTTMHVEISPFTLVLAAIGPDVPPDPF
jgi:hypothetical protein